VIADVRAAVSGLLLSIPPPSIRQFEFGPFTVRLYALSLIAGVAVGAWITYRRWTARGGDPDLVYEVALWATAAGLVGGRLYHVITSWDQVTKTWWGPFAVWEGGLGIWGGILFGTLAGCWIVRRRGASATAFMDAAAPGILIGQAVGRLGNYFNQELFGRPTDLPWALEVDVSRRPAEFLADPTFHPVFLYEIVWNVGLALLLIWIGSRYRIRPPGLFALYVAGYSFSRVFWEQLRVDPANEILGQRVNVYVAVALTIGALAFFVWNQRREPGAAQAPPAGDPPRGGAARPARMKTPAARSGLSPGARGRGRRR
jgi:prolipoprotein diacylglyceryl transferase